MRRILEVERRALTRGDIPLFEVDFDGRNLRDERRVIARGFFEQSGREVILGRSGRLTPRDTRDAVSLLRSCLRLEKGGLSGRPQGALAGRGRR
jgi:hypothetical protein